MPPELKQFDEALTKSGLNENHDVKQLAFALFRPSASSETLTTVGVAQGQFPVQDILANFRKTRRSSPPAHQPDLPARQDGHGALLRRSIDNGFGSKDAVEKALDDPMASMQTS